MIEMTYFDVCKVFRNQEVEDANGISKFQQTLIYSDLSCALDKPNSKNPIDRTESTADITQYLILFISSQYEILPNDIIKITRYGKNYKLYAGDSFHYETHQEIPLSRKMWNGEQL